MAASTAVPAAPWRAPFLAHLAQIPGAEFVLTTVEPPAPSPPAAHTTPARPRARTCIHRGMWAALPRNDKNAAPRNPPAYASDLPTLTTDARMDKAQHLYDIYPGREGAFPTGSGGGGPCEAVYWAKEVMAQWRVRGRGWVVAPDIDGEGEGAVRVRRALERWMRPRDDDEDEEGNRDGAAEGKHEGSESGTWSWARELTAHFGNLSPGMRGSFRNPVPGAPVAGGGGGGGDPGPERALGQKVTDLEDPLAREVFRVVVIEPEEVERLDLADPATARRWRWTLEEGGAAGAAARWKEEELWP